MTKTKLVTALVLAVLGLTVVLQNTAPVETRLLFWTVSMPRAFVLLIVATAGFIVGVVVSLLRVKNKRDRAAGG